MSRSVIIRESGGERTLGDGDFPLHIGSGAGADIRLPGALATDSTALIGLLDDRAFVQLSGSDQVLTVNGESVAGTRWLEDGDRLSAAGVEITYRAADDQLVFDVAYQEAEYETQPPDLGDGETQTGDEIAPVRMRAQPRIAAGGTRKHRWLTGTIYGALILFAVFAFYLFSAKSVLFEVDPPEAEMEVSGGLLQLKVAGRYLLRSGTYAVSITADGYFSLDKEIEVGDEGNQEFEFVMRKLPGRVVVTTVPQVAGQVWVDGELAGEVPSPELTLEPGTYEVKVLTERHLEFVTMLEVEGRDMLQALEAELVPGWADIALSSIPAGATIVADEQILGETPATVEVMAGDRELSLRKDGYKTWRQAMNVVANQAEEFADIELEEADGILTLGSRPEGAAVSVDGQYVGKTPLEVEIDPDTSHRLQLTKPGYEPTNRTVNLDGARTRSIDIELKPRLGVIKIVSRPADAELYVNGRRQGSASTELSLIALPHRIEVRKPGFESYLTEVTPKPGLPQVIEVTLMTPEQAVLAATPKTVKTSQGAVMLLVEPGAFDMGAPRREQGRRANEARRSVKLTRRFYIGVNEVTNREFREFRPTHTSGAEKYRELASDNRPAVMVSWDDAIAFCNWLSDREGLPNAYVSGGTSMVLADPPNPGYRLPTEAEWVWVARYSGGAGQRKYPWGERMPPSDGTGNYADFAAEGFVGNVMQGYDDGYPITAPVAKFSPNPIGVYDLGGNVAEWNNDLYVVASTPPGQVELDPTGPTEGQYHVIRGSSWRHSSISELRLSYRDFGDQGRLDVGFRIARYTDVVSE